MKKAIFIMAAAVLALSSCVKFGNQSNEFDPDFDMSYEFTYGLRKVLEMDPMAPAGVDIVDELDFFKTFSLKLYVENGKISALEFDNGSIPYDSYTFRFPSGKVDAYYDETSVPATLKLSTGEVVAKFINGEFRVDFNLDCEEINYQYFFKTLETTRENR